MTTDSDNPSTAFDPEDESTRPKGGREGKRILVLVVAVVAGIAFGAGSTYVSMRSPANTDRWIQIVSDGNGIGFRTDKVISLDFDLPSAKKPSGKVKFLNRDKGIQLGYILTLPIDPKPTKTLPEKYTHHTQLSDGVEIMPPDQLEYEGNFGFTLKDADGFVLMQLTGPKDYLVASTPNQVQGTVNEPVPASIVKRTKSVAVDFTVTDCIPCDPH